MKRKGFTLIELLAVIVILAIIALIATPIIMNVIENTKEASYDRSVENILHSAEIFAMDMKVTEDLELDKNIYDKIVNQLSGDRPEEGQVYVNKNGEIALSLRYGDYCYTKSYGEKSYYKEKTDENCITPFYYLRGNEVYSNEDIAFLAGPLKRSQIEKIVTVATNEVPNDALGSWDVTVDSSGKVNENIKGKVMAWYKDEDQDNLYEVYIGQEGGVKASSASRLFGYLTNVTEIDLSKLDTSNMTSMLEMFAGNSKLISLNLSGFDTSKVTTMIGMFAGCSSLTYLDVSSFNTANVTDMMRMFQNCSSLTNLDLSNFDTNKVTKMHQMFQSCSSLIRLDLRSFNTSNVTTMFQMFASCYSLTNLDLRSFNTNKVEDMRDMFIRSSGLKEIMVSDKWITEKATTDGMFNACGVSDVTFE